MLGQGPYRAGKNAMDAGETSCVDDVASVAAGDAH
jgi:hypothetical protein